jgi:glycosyltransferase involved in cell wall biosynthesis
MPPTQARLEIDLAFDAMGDHIDGDGVRHIGFHSAAAAISGHKLPLRWMREARCETVEVREDGLALSGAQATVLVLAGLIPAHRWVHVRRGNTRTMCRSRFLTTALVRLVLATATELWHTMRLRYTVLAAAQSEYRLPRYAKRAGSALYIRAEHSVRWYGSSIGGAATHTVGVINGLLANGVRVGVIAPEPFTEVGGVTTWAVTPRRSLHFVPGISEVDYSQAVIAAAPRTGIDFLYQRYVLGGFAGLELAQRLGVPLVLEFNGSGIWVEQQWGGGGVRMEGPLAALERRNLTDASLIVVVSDVLKDQLVAAGIVASRILVNPNGVDAERLAPYRERLPREWRERTGQPQMPTVGFVGTFGPWHGVELLPRLIEASPPTTRWILIGSGDPLHRLVSVEIDTRGLRERVYMTGPVPRERALALLSACDVCISPHVPNTDGSRFFGSPTKLFEYMGLGKAIVASDLEQIGTVIEHERNGLLHAPGDVVAAAAAIERLLADADLRQRLGEAAVKDAHERYSWSANTRRILTALEDPTRGSVATGRD